MRDELWEMLIQADANARYYGHLLERRTRFVQRLAIGAAVISSSSVLMSLSTVAPDAAPFVSTVGAICAVLSTHLKTPEPLARCVVEWRLVERAVTATWHRLERGDHVSHEDADALRARFAAACSMYPESATNQALVDDMYRKALAYRGMTA